VTYTDINQKNAYLDAAKGTPAFSDYNNCKTVPTAIKQYTSGRGTVFLFIVIVDPAVREGIKDRGPIFPEPVGQSVQDGVWIRAGILSSRSNSHLESTVTDDDLRHGLYHSSALPFSMTMNKSQGQSLKYVITTVSRLLVSSSFSKWQECNRFS
jgi:hypothetical protein